MRVTKQAIIDQQAEQISTLVARLKHFQHQPTTKPRRFVAYPLSIDGVEHFVYFESKDAHVGARRIAATGHKVLVTTQRIH